mgnify:CR=1 FL=1
MALTFIIELSSGTLPKTEIIIVDAKQNTTNNNTIIFFVPKDISKDYEFFIGGKGNLVANNIEVFGHYTKRGDKYSYSFIIFIQIYL